MNLSDALQLSGAQAPWWAGFAVVVLTAAAAVARRVVRPSARAQGSRIGELETVLQLEVARRRQVEAALVADGLDLPFWAPDGNASVRPRPRAQHRYPDDPDDVDQADDEQTTALPTQDFTRHHLTRRTTP